MMVPKTKCNVRNTSLNGSALGSRLRRLSFLGTQMRHDLDINTTPFNKLYHANGMKFECTISLTQSVKPHPERYIGYGALSTQ